ncbi:hypothetical protein PMZ80_002530 [Knufia obscura]|uniref:Uncharacterized protein n=1 Tax=Knufia obscura TaxID=1635080 RepID=A0ABR0RXK4_9EURO|nr:hypothetical protein PMZ80_002530 [Knufia obscura]
MAPQGYLFVNKHSNSPSLSRNTGNEASLASKVNKHVQQQRFWKGSGPRQNWYRPFVRSGSSGPTTPSEASFSEDVAEPASERSSPEQRRPSSLARASTEQHRPTSPQRSTTSRRTASARQPRYVPESLVRRHTVQDTTVEKEQRQDEPTPIHVDPTTIVTSRPGDINDPFNHTVVQITPELKDLLDRHLRWAVSSSVSDFTIKEGIQRIYNSVLTDPMHSAAFLAMATAQQRKTSNIVLPHGQSPEFYSYRATRIIREYIESHPQDVEPYTFVDIFRLAMSEWINGNHKAARIHFSYIARNYNDFEPRDAGQWHNIEVISTEDLFLAIDVDEQPLMALSWEPELFAGPHMALPNTEGRDTSSVGSDQPHMDRGRYYDVSRRSPSSTSYAGLTSAFSPGCPLQSITQELLISLQSFPNPSQINFGAATAGSLWAMKRRMHAALHRLQSVDVAEQGLEQCIRRTLLILLFLASTTPSRRVGRTDVPRLAMRLRDALKAMNAVQNQNKSNGRTTCAISSGTAMQHTLLLWMFITGLIAAKEDSVNPDSELLQWFRKRAVILAVQVCGPQPMVEQLNNVLEQYLTFSNVHSGVVEEICTNIRTQTEDLRWVNGGFRVVDGPL